MTERTEDIRILRWAWQQAKAYHRGKLTAEQIAKLESLPDWTWDVAEHERRWKQRVADSRKERQQRESIEQWLAVFEGIFDASECLHHLDRVIRAFGSTELALKALWEAIGEVENPLSQDAIALRTPEIPDRGL